MDRQKLKKERLKPLLLLHAIMLLYSASAIFSKLASGAKFLSLSFLVLYGLVLLLLFVYAILWQQVLKKMPLTTAYANKAVVIIWGLIWGSLFFGEAVTVKKLIASIIVILGVGLVVTDKDE